MEVFCRIELLGGVRLVHADRVIDRFRTRKTAALLAYLVHHSDQPHQREDLIQRYWPAGDLRAGSVNLNQALSSLRRQLEPPGIPRGTVISADRKSVRLNPEGVSTDVALFEAAIR